MFYSPCTIDPGKAQGTELRLQLLLALRRRASAKGQVRGMGLRVLLVLRERAFGRGAVSGNDGPRYPRAASI